jgi:hypothetical protein
MSVTVERIEPRIYLSLYTGKATTEEVIEVIKGRKALADEHQEPAYVSITDVSGITSFPLDMTSLRNIAETDPRNMRYLLVGASLQMQILVESFGGRGSSAIEFFKTLDEAVTRAHVLLEERDQP